MKLTGHQLKAHLTKGFAPLYLIHGNEPSLVQELCMLLSDTWQQQGPSEKISVTIETEHQWESLETELNSGSLFNNRTCFEIHLPKAKLSQYGANLLKNYAKDPLPDSCLWVVAPKLSSKIMSSTWVKALDKVGVVVTVAHITLQQFPTWLQERLSQAKLKLTPEATKTLTYLLSGNIDAALQALQKLALLNPKQSPLNQEQLLACIADSAQFSIYDLIDQILKAEWAALIRSLECLQSQVEPLLVLWGLTTQLRSCHQMAYLIQQGQSVAAAMQAHHVWSNRKALLGRVLTAYPLAHWQTCLQQAARLDQQIKNTSTINIWHELHQLCLQIAGANIPFPAQVETL